MANIVDDQGNYLGPPVTKGGGGYDSPHSRRERATRARYGGASSQAGQVELYTAQRRFALAEMKKYGVRVPPGVDPVAYYHTTGSRLIYRQTHQGLYKPKPAGLEPAGGPGKPVTLRPGSDVADDGGKTPMPDGSTGGGGGGVADTSRMKENLDRMRNAQDVARGSSPAAGAQAVQDAYQAQAAHVAAGAQAQAASGGGGVGGSAGVAGGRAPDPVAEAAKHKLALSLLVSALHAPPPTRNQDTYRRR